MWPGNFDWQGEDWAALSGATAATAGTAWNTATGQAVETRATWADAKVGLARVFVLRSELCSETTVVFKRPLLCEANSALSVVTALLREPF
jgi:hypothetical protein